MAHEQAFCVSIYTNDTEQEQVGEQWFAEELQAHQKMDAVSRRGGWSTLQVSPWCAVPPVVRARLVLADGWAYTAKQAFRGNWPGGCVGLTQSEYYKQAVSRLDALANAGDEEGVKREFKRLWDWLKSQTA